jgi:hypothetical protein
MSRFETVEVFAGFVLDVHGDVFSARFRSITRPGVEEEGEIPLVEIAEKDRKNVVPGAWFKWHIAFYEDELKLRASFFRFSEDTWSATELATAHELAVKMLHSIDGMGK